MHQRCGDGVQRRASKTPSEEGFEACDDGNEDNGDTCLNTCAAARCGDGMVRIGVEECDDGNQLQTDAFNNCAQRRAAATGWCKTAWRAVTTPTRCKRTRLNNCTVASCG